MDVRAKELLVEQRGLVAMWQLRGAGLSRREALTAVRDLREIHDGVHLAGFAEPTGWQVWRAATLTAPLTFLGNFSAGACFGFRPNPGSFESVVRHGDRGLRRHGRLMVFHSRALAGDTTTRDGIPITTPERTLIDLSASMGDKERRKMLREALRIGATTVPSLEACLRKHRGRRGTAKLNELASEYARLKLDRCRSDAEAYAMEVLAASNRPLPELNLTIAGFEADLVWPERRVIVEIDGPQYHRDKLHDARRTKAWTDAGYTVRRLGSAELFEQPQRLLRAAAP